MAACESLYSRDMLAVSAPTHNGRSLEVPTHMRQVASSASLSLSELDKDESRLSVTPSMEPDGADLALLEECVEELACAPVHFQELLTEELELFPSPEHAGPDKRTSMALQPASSKKQRTLIQKYLLWGRLSGPFLLFTVVGAVLIIFARSHLMQLLRLLQNLPWLESLVVFIFLFTLVSFPFGFGYIILNMTAGYLYGLVRGQIVVMISVAVGFTLSFLLCRIWFREYARRIITSNALHALMRVVEGRHGMKVIVLTRLTPIPFGLQNVLFAMTSVSYWTCLLSSVIGLFPTQFLNTYMGSTVRNMQEVLGDRADGYIILTAQVLFSIILTLYLVRKARQELAKLTENGDEQDKVKSLA